MAKLQSFKRIISEDFSEKDRPLIQKLAYSINVFAEDVLNAFNNKLTIEDNFNISKKDLTITVDNSGKVISNNSLKTDLDHSCQGVLVIRATNLTSSTTYPSGTPFISFAESSNGIININNITNLTANNQYKLKLVLF